MRTIIAALIVLAAAPPTPAADLKVVADFPGGSARVEGIDQKTRTVRIVPTPHADRGWVCWWYFKLEGVEKGETITLDVGGGVWATPDQAAVSTDDKAWKHTAAGKREAKDRIVFRHTAEADTLWFAWGPPFTLRHARELIDAATKANKHATAFELCQSKDGHAVPGLKVEEPGVPDADRLGIWVNARQHAWESGSSWVCRGFVEWLLSDDEAAKALRKKATVYVVPIMDVDNVERGAGGKNQKPHDHNRDWTGKAVHPEVRAAMKRLGEMHAAGRLDLFLDLHNPAAGDKTPFFFVPPPELLAQRGRDNLDRFLTAARKEMVGPPAVSAKPRESGANYDPMWKAISKNWVAAETKGGAVAVTLETSWNTRYGTTDGYRLVGKELARAVELYLRESPRGK